MSEEKKYLSFDEFAQPDPVEYEDVPVQGGLVRIGSLTAAEWSEWNAMREEAQGRKLSGAYLISVSLVDGQGKRIGKTDPLSLEKLRTKNIKNNEVILRAVFRLNGFGAGVGLVAAQAKNVSGEAPTVN